MNAKRTALILIAFALALAGCMVMPAETDGGMKPIAPSAVPTAAPTAAPTGGVELTILASGSGVTVLEYEGAGVRCIIASGASVDMVCQNTTPTVPAQPTPADQPKHQVPNGSSEA